MNPHDSVGVRMLTIIGMIESEWWGWAIDFEDKISIHSGPSFVSIPLADAEVTFHTHRLAGIKKAAKALTLKEYYGAKK